MTKKILFLLFSFILLSTSVRAQDSNFPMLTIEEEDGSPSTIPWKLKVPNGSLTPNADYSSSLSFSADSLSAGTLSLSSGSITDTSGAISFGDENVSTTATSDSATSAISSTRNASVLQDGSASTGTNESDDNLYEAVKFTASASHEMRSFGARVKRTGAITNPANGIHGEIWTDVAGSPGAKIDGLNYVYYGYLTEAYQECQFYINETLVSGTAYWFVLRQDVAPAGGTVQIDSVNTGTAVHSKSADGAAWTNEDNKTLWYKLYGRTGYAVYGYSQNADALEGSSVNQAGVKGYSVFDVGVLAYSDTSYGVYSTGVSGQGVYGISTNNVGVQGVSTNHYGIFGMGSNASYAAVCGLHTTGAGMAGFSTDNFGGVGVSTNYAGLSGESTNGIGGVFSVNPASTDTVAEILRLQRTSSGAPANGIGGSIDWHLENNANETELSARISGVLTDVVNGTEDSDLRFSTRIAGSVSEQFRIYGIAGYSIWYSPNSILNVAGGNHQYFYDSTFAKYVDLDWSGANPVLRSSSGTFNLDDDNLTFTGTLGAGVSTLSTVNFGSATGVSATATAGVLTLTGMGGGTHENLTLDFEGASNVIEVNSSSGANALNFRFPYSKWGAEGQYIAFDTTGASPILFTTGYSDPVEFRTGPITIYNKLSLALTDATTNTVSEITRNTHSGGAVVNNFGSYHSEFLEDATAGTIREASRIGTLWTDATDATRTSAITFSGVTSGGALTEWGRFQGNMLGVGITPTYRLHVPWLSGDTVTTAYFGSNNASNNRIAVRGESYNGTGIYGVSTDNIGTGGSSTSSTGIYGASTSGVGTYGASTSGIGGYFTVNPASTNTVVEIIRLRRQTSDTAADGIGGGIDWYLEDSAGTDELTGRISNLLTTATSGSEASALTFWTRTGGAAIAEMARIDGDTTAGNTRFMLYDVDNATLERVSIGAQDSGGAGFKVLRIPN